MARATASAMEHPVRTREAVEAELRGATGTLEEARRRVRAIRAATDPNLATVDAPTLDRTAFWRLRANQPAAELELARAEVHVQELRAEHGRLREADIAQLTEAFTAEIRPLIVELDRRLSAAVEVNVRLADLTQQYHERTGLYVDTAAWPELLEPTPTFEARFTVWHRMLVEQGHLT